MRFNPASELRQFLLYFFTGLIIGWMLGIPGYLVTLVLVIYIIWNLRQLFRLHKWLKQSNPTDPPSSHGLWGAVFDEIYKLQQRQLKYRARLKKVIKRFRDSTFALPDGFVMLDDEGNLEWWNPAAERLLGLVTRSDVNQLITNLIRDPAFKEYFESFDYEKSLELNSPINDQVTLQYQIALYGKKDRLMIVRDITEMRKLEQMRTDFVANMSHELRTPITVLNGYLETMADSHEEIAPPWRRAINSMQKQTERLRVLVQDLLTLSTLETRSTSSLQVVDMTTLMERVYQDLKPITEKKNQPFSFSTEAEHQLLGNMDELYSLISNLVVNASKYSPEETPIEVKWYTNATGGRLAVTDKGVGIGANDIPRLTERFYRVDKGRNSDVGGTGLGLAIVKHILINHDGNLEIESELDKGSTFTCKFPNHRIQPAAKSVANS